MDELELKNRLFKAVRGLLDHSRFYQKDFGDVVGIYDAHTCDLFFPSPELLPFIIAESDAELENLFIEREIDPEYDPLPDSISFLEDLIAEPMGSIHHPYSVNEIAKLKLNFSTECNMGCLYCFRDKEARHEKPDLALLFKAIDNLDEDYGRNSKSHTVCCNLTGEPLLYLKEIQAVNQYMEQQDKNRKREMGFYFLTNGTVLTDESLQVIQQLKNVKSISISLDGPKEVHDRLRVFQSGKGTFDLIRENMARFQEAGYNLCAEGVITKLYPEPLELLKAYLEMGFSEVKMKPVRQGNPYSFDRDSLEKLKEGYRKYFSFIAERLIEQDYSILRVLSNDYGLRPLWKILLKSRRKVRCDWGVNSLSMDREGNFYPCDSLMGMEAYRVGSVESGVDWQKYHTDLTVDNREPCKNCYARYICGGTCYANTVYSGQKAIDVDSFECELSLFLMDENLDLIKKLYFENVDIDLVKNLLYRNLERIYY